MIGLTSPGRAHDSPVKPARDAQGVDLHKAGSKQELCVLTRAYWARSQVLAARLEP